MGVNQVEKWKETRKKNNAAIFRKKSEGMELRLLITRPVFNEEELSIFNETEGKDSYEVHCRSVTISR